MSQFLNCIKQLIFGKGNNDDLENKEKKYKKMMDNTNITKEQDKKEINDLLIDISQNMEEDETRGLNIDYLEAFFDSIFPANIPNISNEIKNYFNAEIKNFKNSNDNSTNLFKLENFDKDKSFCFICAIKKVDQKTCDIIYKFKIINKKIEKIKKIVDENEQSKQLLNDFKEKELKQLNEKIMN